MFGCPLLPASPADGAVRYPALVALVLAGFPFTADHLAVLPGENIEGGRRAVPDDAHDLSDVAWAAGDVVVEDRDVRKVSDVLRVFRFVAEAAEPLGKQLSLFGVRRANCVWGRCCVIGVCHGEKRK